MATVAAYPYADWPRMGRAEARLSSQLARARGSLAGRAALDDLRAWLGAPVELIDAGTRLADAASVAASVGASVGLVVAVGAHRAVIAITPGVARAIADRVVGGAGTDVALGPTPLTRGEAGLVGYAVGRALDRARAPGALLDAAPAREAIASLGGRVVTIAAELIVGGARGNVLVAVPLEAIPALASSPPAVDPSLPVRASIVIGDALLPARELATLAPGDVIVPDAWSIDPRLADVGRARLVIGRSARTFELELVSGRYHVASPTSLPASRPPARWGTRKKASMSRAEPDTLPSLADVEVELTIELARLEMPVGEVAALAPGVVLTTGRLVGERVAVRAGDRIVAWGELVDVEGEVGVRVTEIGR